MTKEKLIKLISEVMYFREPNLSPPDAMKLVNDFLTHNPDYITKNVVSDDIIKCDYKYHNACIKRFGLCNNCGAAR